MAALAHPKIDFKLILCQAASADAASGTLHMLGAGWSRTGSPTAAQAVALLVKVPWDRANEKLLMKVQLLTEDGKPVELPGPGGLQTIAAEVTFEVGRPPGVSHGSPLDAALAFNFPQMPLPPGRYQWRAEIARDVQEESFEVVLAP